MGVRRHTHWGGRGWTLWEAPAVNGTIEWQVMVLIAAFCASMVLSGVQMASYTAFTTSGARVGDPGNNLIGPS